MMKQIKAVVITAIITLLTLGSVVYTSCKKDHCKTLNCLHGGACNDGFCLCPSGYTGVYCEVPNSAIIGFRNKTFTPVLVTIQGVNYTVDTGKTLTFNGGYGDTISAIATTHGTYGINVGLAAIKVGYALAGTTTYDLVVPSTYFFLKVINTNVTEPFVSLAHVNYLQRDETLDVVHVNNDGQTYYIGYYKAYSDTHIRLEKTPSYKDYNVLGLPMTVNQSYTALYN